MTAEEKIIAQEMYKEGKSTASIAKELHYSSATIARNLFGGNGKAGRRLENAIYPGLVKWLADNNKTVTDFNVMVCGKKNQQMSLILHGTTMPNKRTIDKILAITGLTYEEAFRTAEDVKANE